MNASRMRREAAIYLAEWMLSHFPKLIFNDEESYERDPWHMMKETAMLFSHRHMAGPRQRLE